MEYRYEEIEPPDKPGNTTFNHEVQDLEFSRFNDQQIKEINNISITHILPKKLKLVTIKIIKKPNSLSLDQIKDLFFNEKRVPLFSRIKEWIFGYRRYLKITIREKSYYYPK